MPKIFTSKNHRLSVLGGHKTTLATRLNSVTLRINSSKYARITPRRTRTRTPERATQMLHEKMDEEDANARLNAQVSTSCAVNLQAASKKARARATQFQVNETGKMRRRMTTTTTGVQQRCKYWLARQLRCQEAGTKTSKKPINSENGGFNQSIDCIKSIGSHIFLGTLSMCRETCNVTWMQRVT